MAARGAKRTRKENILARFGHALGDRRGLSAMEFALLLPIMIMFYFGAVEITQLLTIDRKVTKAASSVGDLVARSVSLDDAEVTDIFEATASILLPFPADGMQVRITSVLADNSNNTTVDWSDGFNMPPLGRGAPVDVPDGLTEPNTSVVRVEVSYTYTSIVGMFLTGGITMDDTFYLRPRETTAVERL